jgi:hypothetical protein
MKKLLYSIVLYSSFGISFVSAGSDSSMTRSAHHKQREAKKTSLTETSAGSLSQQLLPSINPQDSDESSSARVAQNKQKDVKKTSPAETSAGNSSQQPPPSINPKDSDGSSTARVAQNKQKDVKKTSPAETSAGNSSQQPPLSIAQFNVLCPKIEPKDPEYENYCIFGVKINKLVKKPISLHYTYSTEDSCFSQGIYSAEECKTLAAKTDKSIMLLSVNQGKTAFGFKPFFFKTLIITSPNGSTNTCNPGSLLYDDNVQTALQAKDLGSGAKWAHKKFIIKDWRTKYQEGEVLFFIEYDGRLFISFSEENADVDLTKITEKDWKTSTLKKVGTVLAAAAAIGGAIYAGQNAHSNATGQYNGSKDVPPSPQNTTTGQAVSADKSQTETPKAPDSSSEQNTSPQNTTTEQAVSADKSQTETPKTPDPSSEQNTQPETTQPEQAVSVDKSQTETPKASDSSFGQNTPPETTQPEQAVSADESQTETPKAPDFSSEQNTPPETTQPEQAVSADKSQTETPKAPDPSSEQNTLTKTTQPEQAVSADKSQTETPKAPDSSSEQNTPPETTQPGQAVSADKSQTETLKAPDSSFEQNTPPETTQPKQAVSAGKSPVGDQS